MTSHINNENLHAHVFAIDILPSSATISTGGGIRSHQIIEGLRRHGFDVTYSVPRVTDLAKANWEKLTKEERTNSYSWEIGSTYDDIVGRFKPDVVVCLWPNVYTFPRHRREGPIIIHDVNGLQNVEQVLANIASGDVGASLQHLTKQYLNKLLVADILLCGSFDQQAYWSGLLSFHLDSFTVPDMIRIPYYPPDEPIVGPYSPGKPTFFCTGSFLPWNSPEGHLFASALMLQRAGRGEIIVVGKPNANMTHAPAVNGEFAALRRFDFVHLMEGVPYPKLSSLMNNRGIAIELSARTLERAFAVPIRTVNYLAHGVPVITNNYSSLSYDVASYNAGWCVDPTNPSKFNDVFQQVLQTPNGQLSVMSANARRLGKERFEARDGFSILKERVITKQRQKARKIGTLSGLTLNNRDNRPCVLVISDEYENLLNLRVRIPFDAMHKAGRIKGYHVLLNGEIVHSAGNLDEIRLIDAIWVQRAPRFNPQSLIDTFGGRFVYDIDDNLLSSPVYRPQCTVEYATLIGSLLREAGTVTTTNARLTSSLQRLSGVQIEHKTVIAPNVTDKVELLHREGQPEGLLITCSDYLPLTKSMKSFKGAVQTFSRAKQLPIIYIGPGVNDFSGFDAPVHSTGMLRYEQYRDYIRQHKLMAVAALEGHADKQTQDFINSKSDIKMVEFGSTGVPAVYADVAPYRETPLCAGPLADIWDEEALVDSLEDVYANADKWRAQASESVAAHRMADDVVGETWFLAIQTMRLNVPFDLAEVLERHKHHPMYSRETARSGESFNASFSGQKAGGQAAGSGGADRACHGYLSARLPARKATHPGSADKPRDMPLRTRADLFEENRSPMGFEIRAAQAIQSMAPHSPGNGPAEPALGPYLAVWKKIRLTLRKAALRSGLEKYPVLFDQHYYLEEYPDVQKSKMDPYLHYLSHGISERRNPNKYFDTYWYLERNPDADKEGFDPLGHYMREGVRRGLDPGPDFSTRIYLNRHPDLERRGVNPLQHFLDCSRGRSATAKK